MRLIIGIRQESHSTNILKRNKISCFGVNLILLKYRSRTLKCCIDSLIRTVRKEKLEHTKVVIRKS
jgi:hypothetical protein